MENIIDDDPDFFSWKYFIIPESEEERNNIVLELEDAFFKKDDVNRFVKEKEVAKTIQKEKTSKQDKAKVFPCRAGMKWDEIEIALLPAEDKFMVKTPHGHGYYDHLDLELYHHRAKSSKPITLWHFLKQLADMNGFFPLEGVQNFEKLSSNAKRLNKHLQKLFEIKESIYKDRCDRIGGYKTKFKISQISDNNAMISHKSLIDEELENPKYSNIKESSYYPEHSTFKNK